MHEVSFKGCTSWLMLRGMPSHLWTLYCMAASISQVQVLHDGACTPVYTKSWP